MRSPAKHPTPQHCGCSTTKPPHGRSLGRERLLPHPPPQPPCHVGLSSPSVWSQPHSTINICLCVFLSPTHVGSAQAAIKRVTATLAQAMDTRLSGAGESKIKGSGGWVPRKTHFPAFRRHLLCVTSHGRSGRWPGGGREWREREREHSAVSSYKGTNPTQGPHTRDLT